MPELCTHHKWTLHRWRGIHHHEPKAAYRRRCNTIAAQCKKCRPKETR